MQSQLCNDAMRDNVIENRLPVLTHPLLIVVLPAYNEGKYIGRAIASLRRQSWVDFAVLITDNGSTDETESIGRAAEKEDARFHYFRHPANLGAIGNFNFGRRATESPYFMWMGSHDMIAADFLERHLAALQGDRRLSLSYAHTGWIDENDELFMTTPSSRLEALPRTAIGRYLASASRLSECTAINNVLRRSFMDDMDLENVAGADHIMLSHLAFRGPVNCIAEPLYFRREQLEKRDDYMLRMTGIAGLKKDRVPLVSSYSNDLGNLLQGNPFKHLACAAVRIIIERRYSIETAGFVAFTHYKLTKAYRIMMKYLNKVSHR